MTTDKFNNNEKLGSITVSIGKPDKTGRRGVGVEFTVKQAEGETLEEYEARFEWFKNKAMKEVR